MTENDPDVIPQIKQYDNQKNCACCYYYRVQAVFLEPPRRDAIGVYRYCEFASGPEWADDEEYPYPPGKTCCQLFRDKVLL